jgi:2-keto-3-deoxy-L-rhamnonate aldolase RhmA
MRFRSLVVVALVVVALLGTIGFAQNSSKGRLNPMIALHEKNLPVFGITHPAISAGGGRGQGRGQAPGQAAPATPPAAPAVTPVQPVLADVARETMAYKFSDFEYNSYSTATADRFLGYMAALIAAGGSMRTHAFISKAPIVHTNPEAATARIIEQLNAGHAGIIMQEVESADEVRQALSAMRFRSKGGTRPEEGIGLAAAYWGLTPAEYREKADPWPLNKNGELILWAIIESKKGIANVREIAAVPGVTVLTVGAGTLGGVFTTTTADGQRVRDQAGFDAGVAAVLAACKEFKVQCSHPANNPAEIERLMGMGFKVFTMQSRNQAAFEAVETGRRLSGRPLPSRSN